MRATLERSEPAPNPTPSLFASSLPDRFRTISPYAAHWPLWDPLGPETLQGLAGQELTKAIDESNGQLLELFQWLYALRGPGAAEMDFPLMPPKRSFRVNITIGRVERGKPAPYALEDDDSA